MSRSMDFRWFLFSTVRHLDKTRLLLHLGRKYRVEANFAWGRGVNRFPKSVVWGRFWCGWWHKNRIPQQQREALIDISTKEKNFYEVMSSANHDVGKKFPKKNKCYWLLVRTHCILRTYSPTILVTVPWRASISRSSITSSCDDSRIYVSADRVYAFVGYLTKNK